VKRRPMAVLEWLAFGGIAVTFIASLAAHVPTKTGLEILAITNGPLILAVAVGGLVTRWRWWRTSRAVDSQIAADDEYRRSRGWTN
jgi:hypothetical protein